MKKINYFSLCILALFSCKNKSAESENIERKISQQPNILFICVDDLRPELGCYGSEYIHSPNIDELAQTGAVFTNHFVSIPTCGASRSSLLTGMYPRTKGHLSNEAIHKLISGKPETEAPETFIHHLRRNGYYTVGIGKISHYADGLLYGYTDSVGSELELPHSWDEMLFDPGKWETGWNAFFGYADGENRQSLNRQVAPYEKGDVEDIGYPDGLTANLALSKLAELAQKKQPFFLGVGFFKPHLPFNAPAKYWDLYKEEDLPLSPNPAIPANVHKASLHASGEFNGYRLGDEQASLEGPVSDAYARKLRHAYFACISYVDAQVGKLLGELDELGLAENTVVVLWGDHGWHLGDQLVWGKHTIFERALKSAFIVRVPGMTTGQTVNRVVSTVDIYPTLMDLCEVAMPHVTDGRSMLPFLGDKPAEWDDEAFGYFRNGISLRTDRYRLSKYFRQEEPVIELYDHLTDPHETKNIAAEHPEVIEKLMPVWEKGNTGLYEK
ncbi:sulfatase [uncultured Sunxiuqinia sp.]|uniref:sulfatase n=1 Tax=uncultured Sunxiuqinia sp. TaxID=1573825 RepID=UPI00262BB8DE|nr:sulfatase [uncultured Sunxiuqinia sp.]